MKHISFLIAVSASMSVAFCGATQAAPITPLPLASDATSAKITPVYYHHWYYHHWHHHYWHHGGYPVAGFWNYYRTSWPGRGTDVESTR
jgi:hypothetical protein